jgi:hypothetical protein
MRAKLGAAIVTAGLIINGAAGKPDAGLSPAEAAGLFAEARPQVEAVMGYRFDPPPRFRVANERDLENWRRAEVEAEIGWQFPDIAKAGGIAVAETARQARRGYMSACIAGASSGREIILFRSNAAKIAAWSPTLAGLNTRAFTQLALVHEAVRMSLESRYNIMDRQRACADGDSFLATQALVEGRAQWVTREVARQLGTQAAFPLLAEIWLHVPDGLSDPAMRAATQEFYRRRYWMLASGLAFQDALVSAGTNDEATMFNRHIPSMWIDHPDRYVRALRERRTGLEVVLASLECTLPPDLWEPRQETCTPEMIKQAAGTFGERDRAESALASCEEAGQVVWTGKPAGRAIALNLIRFETPVAAGAYYRFALALQQKADQRLANGSGALRLVDERSKTFVVSGVDACTWTDKKLAVSGSPGRRDSSIPASTILAHDGVLVIEIQWQNLPGDMNWARRAIETIHSMRGP